MMEAKQIHDPFADDDDALEDLKRALEGEERGAAGAALALAASSSAGAAALLDEKPDLRDAVASGAITWDSLMTEEA